MKSIRALNLLTISVISVVPIASIISCESPIRPLSISGTIETIDDENNDNPFKIYNIPFSNTHKTLFTVDQLELLKKHLRSKLYYGPEAWDLKSITLDPGIITSGTQLGVYYPNTKQIFINIADLENVSLSNFSFNQIEDVITKIIAHEYGHHFFATYANGYRYKGVIDPCIMNERNYVYDNSGDPRYLSAWNKDYFNFFVNTYNMNHEKEKPFKKVNYKENNIDSTFTLTQLFDNANKKGSKLDWGNQDKVVFASSAFENLHKAWKPSSYIVSINKSNQDSLKYIYSMDEQVTRKMQMLFYPGEISTGKYSFDSSLVKISSGENTFFDPYAIDWLRTAELYLNEDEHKIEKVPIYKDDIFTNYNGSKDSFDRNTKIDKPKNAYDELLKLMGYGKQISHMYSKNSALVVDSDTITGMSKDNDNFVKISGFVDKSKGYKYIVDENDNLVSKLNLSFSKDKLEDKFHFFAKKTWDSSEANLMPETYDDDKKKLLLYLTDYFDVSSFENKKLYFTDKLGGKKVNITSINESTDGTNVNSYDAQRPYDDVYYKIVNHDGTVIVKRYA